jgi:hypothetical protein
MSQDKQLDVFLAAVRRQDSERAFEIYRSLDFETQQRALITIQAEIAERKDQVKVSTYLFAQLELFGGGNRCGRAA